jgi:hypothetical protein
MGALKEQDEKLLAEFRRQVGKQYKVGDEVIGWVTAIFDYGVFIENQEFQMSGLLHRRLVSRTKYMSGIDDLRRHFQVGDEVRAKVAEIRDGKLSLCTFDYELPVYGFNSLGALIKKDEIKVTEKPSELDEIIDEMSIKVGGVSSPARNRVAELIGKYGVIKFAMALAKAIESYEPIDQSMLLVEEIEKQAGVKSPKRTFIISPHAKQRWQERGDGSDLMERIVKAKLVFEDIHNARRLFSDDVYTFPCTITDTGENAVRTVEKWGE